MKSQAKKIRALLSKQELQQVCEALQDKMAGLIRSEEDLRKPGIPPKLAGSLANDIKDEFDALHLLDLKLLRYIQVIDGRVQR